MHLRVAASLAVFAVGFAAAAAVQPPRATPASLGIDPEPLAALDADIASGKFPLVDSLLVMRCGEVLFERRYPHDYGQSTAKKRAPGVP